MAKAQKKPAAADHNDNPLSKVFGGIRRTFLAIGLLSGAVNILMLTGPMFMLQIYDRVLASGSLPTLAALFGLVAALFLFLGLFDLLRTRITSRMGYNLDVELMPITKRAWILAGLSPNSKAGRPLTDLTVLRQFFSGNGLPALFDLPWVPFYLGIVYLLHVWLGLLATVGAVIVVTATVVSEKITKTPISEANGWEQQDTNFAERSNRNAEAIVAMGMTGNVINHWQRLRKTALFHTQTAGTRSENITSLTKAVRMLLQSGMLALGALLAINQEITPGTMIAASILGGRALAPVDTAVANWKNFIRARQAYARLSVVLAAADSKKPPLQLPEPKGHLQVSGLTKMTGGGSGSQRESKPILQNIQFELKPGDAVGVIGPSGSGKSTLARLLVGIWKPDRGSVRLDGASHDQWESDILGRHIGYLPQSVEMIAGTIKQNIARFDPGVSDEEAVQAAKLADVHDLILKLPNGYETDLGASGFLLSGGQVQRIALARAVLGQPALVVLDEPNANLDTIGDTALTNTIRQLRQSGSCVVVMAHRPSAIAAVNLLLMLHDGKQVAFGEKEEVLRQVTKTAGRAADQKQKPGPEQE